MFERVSERARRVLFFAREEASQLGSTSIDTEHLLLGLIRESKGLTSWEACRLNPGNIPSVAHAQFLERTLRVLNTWKRQGIDVG